MAKIEVLSATPFWLSNFHQIVFVIFGLHGRSHCQIFLAAADVQQEELCQSE